MKFHLRAHGTTLKTFGRDTCDIVVLIYSVVERCLNALRDPSHY